MRAGAVCAFLYVLVFVGGQAYLGSQPQAQYPAKSSLDEQARIFLTYAHQHGSLVVIGSLLAVLGYVLLGGVAIGITPVLQPDRNRMARIALVVGLLSVCISIIGVVVEAIGLQSAAQQLAGAHTSAAQQAAVHNFRSKTGPFQVLDLAGSLGIALWLGLVGLTLIRILGRRSLAAWGTVASCLLSGIGFPVLVAWAAGAGLGLWRTAREWSPISPPSPVYDDGADEEPPPTIARTGSPGASASTLAERSGMDAEAMSRARAAGARGSKGRGKRRR
jgi:hypothetical protein